MPNRRSAAKRLRQSEERRVRNKARHTELKNLRKKILRAVNDAKGDEADQLLRRYYRRVDQACCHSVLHKNTGSRRKALLARHVQELRQKAS